MLSPIEGKSNIIVFPRDRRSATMLVKEDTVL